jgi:LPS sulfotransferase NodH
MYREKVCPKCQKKHRKRGIHCSQSCANLHRPASDKTKDALRKTAIEYNRTPEGIAQQKLFNSGLVSDDFAVSIPELSPDLSDYNDYNKAEDW